MLIMAIVLFVIGIAAISLSAQAEIDTHAFLFRLFVVYALTVLVILAASMVPQ